MSGGSGCLEQRGSVFGLPISNPRAQRRTSLTCLLDRLDRWSDPAVSSAETLVPLRCSVPAKAPLSLPFLWLGHMLAGLLVGWGPSREPEDPLPSTSS